MLPASYYTALSARSIRNKISRNEVKVAERTVAGTAPSEASEHIFSGPLPFNGTDGKPEYVCSKCLRKRSYLAIENIDCNTSIRLNMEASRKYKISNGYPIN